MAREHPDTDIPPWMNAVAYGGKIYTLTPGLRVAAIATLESDDETRTWRAGEAEEFRERCADARREVTSDS